jgi:hypothetical protein
MLFAGRAARPLAEFRKRHEHALAELFTGALGLRGRAGLAEVGMIAIDGTKIAANASLDANRSYEAIAREILQEAADTDRREDELYGSARGDELPEQLRTREGRRAALCEAKCKLDEEAAKPESGAPEGAPDREVGLELDPEQFVTRSWGRRNWFREARWGLDDQRERKAHRMSSPGCWPGRAARSSRRAPQRRPASSTAKRKRSSKRGELD